MDKQRFIGVIIGQAVGDAVGFPIEGSGPSTCSNYIEDMKEDFTIPAARGLKGGQFTDDTQLAIALLQTLVENKGYHHKYYSQKMANLFSTDKIVGRGIATDRAVSKIIKGVNLNETATPAPSAGNGTAMRASPIGMYYVDNQDDLIKYARKQGQLTHADPRCDAGSVAIASGVSYLLNFDTSRNLDKNNMIEYIAATIEPISQLFAQNILQLKEVIELDVIGAARLISTWGDPDFLDGWKYISPYVIPSVCWAFYAFLSNFDNFEDAIYSSIGCGGDVDTTGAMTGALAGAYLGVDQIPLQWRNQIHDRDDWNMESIINLAENAYDQKFTD